MFYLGYYKLINGSLEIENSYKYTLINWLQAINGSKHNFSMKNNFIYYHFDLRMYVIIWTVITMSIKSK